MSWKESPAFVKHILKCEPTSHKVNGQDIDFYPVSPGICFKLRELGKPISKALAVFFQGQKISEQGKAFRTTTTPELHETISEGVEAPIAQMMYDQTAKAIEEVFDGLAGNDTIDAIGSIIIDSCRRSVFPNMERDKLPSGAEFLDEIGLPTFTALLVGTVKANRGVFGPLAESMGPAFKEAVEAATERLRASLKKTKSSEPIGQANPDAKEQEPPQAIPTTDGTNSEPTSSSSSDAATP